MVMKINDARALNQPSTFGSVGQVPDGASQKAPIENAAAQPAATIDLSQAVQTTRSSAVDGPDESLDLALVEEIRQRIQSGTFQIDHTQIAQGLLRDAVLATRR